MYAQYNSATQNMSTNVLVFPVTVGAPFYVENMLEELDQEVGTLKRTVWYFGTSVVWYFEEGGVVL